VVDAIIAALEVADGKHDRPFPITCSRPLRHLVEHERERIIASLASSAWARRCIRRPVNTASRRTTSSDGVHVAATSPSANSCSPPAHLGRPCGAGPRARRCGQTGRTTDGRDAGPPWPELGGGDAGREWLRARRVGLRAPAAPGARRYGGRHRHKRRPRFAKAFAAKLAKRSGVAFEPNSDFFESLSAQDAAVEASGQLKVIAVSLMKIANDLRWMNSGPLAARRDRVARAAARFLDHAGQGQPVIPRRPQVAASHRNDAAITMAARRATSSELMLPTTRATARVDPVAGRGQPSLADKCIAGSR